MIGLDIVLRLARFALSFFVAGFGLLGGVSLWFSFAHYDAALYAIKYIGIGAGLEYIRVYYLPT